MVGGGGGGRGSKNGEVDYSETVRTSPGLIDLRLI